MKRTFAAWISCAIFSWFLAAGDLLDTKKGITVGARAYLVANANPAHEYSLDFTPIETFSDELGQTHIRFEPWLNGMLVHGVHRIVHIQTETGEVLDTDGDFLIGERSIDQYPHVDPFGEVAPAIGTEDFTIIEADVLAYALDEQQEAVISFKYVVEYESESGPQREELFFETSTSLLVARHPQYHYGRNRLTHSRKPSQSLPGTLMRKEGDTPIGEPCLDDAHDYAGVTYDYYRNIFGRDSFDNKGHDLVSTVMYGFHSNNSFWDSRRKQVVFGDGDGVNFSCLSSGLDIVAHEWTHALTSHTARLAFWGESGALNEATSDIFAAAVESYKGASPFEIWEIGEGVWTPHVGGDAWRYMYQPTWDGVSRDYYPDRYTGKLDSGGVHWNSGIANLFFYLLSEGGQHPNNKTSIVVQGIGINDAERIWYRALTVYMNPSTNFLGARVATLKAARDLFKMGSLQYQQTCRAWAAVGVGTCCFGFTAPQLTWTHSDCDAKGTAKWTPVACASKYEVYYRKNSTSSWRLYNTYGSKVTSAFLNLPYSCEIKVKAIGDVDLKESVDSNILFVQHYGGCI